MDRPVFARAVRGLVVAATLVGAGRAAAIQPTWVRTHNGPGSGADAAHGITLGSDGNVFAAGERTAAGGDLDFTTWARKPNGDLHWGPIVYDGPGSGGADSARAIAADGAGNVYVTGSSHGSGTSLDYATIRYAEGDGSVAWTARYDSPSHGSDSPAAIATDAAGNVYVTGTSANDWATVKYAPDGTQLWAVRRAGGSARDLAVDGAGNVYVTGTGGGATTVKYDTNGNVLWTRSYTPPPPGLTAQATAVALDASGNVYVGGSSNNDPGETDALLVKYSSAGVQQWVREPGQGGDVVNDMAIDAAGNVYIAGRQRASVNFLLKAMFATKFSPAGTELWSTTWSGAGTGSNNDEALGLALGSSTVWVTGRSCSDDLCFDGTFMATLKLAADDGDVLMWDFEGPPGAGHDVAVDGLYGYVAGTRAERFATLKYGLLLRWFPMLVITFDAQRLGDSSRTLLTALNDGADDVAVLGIEPAHGDCGAFAVRGPALPLRIAPGESLELAVEFQPRALGAHECVFAIDTDGDDTDAELVVGGTGSDGEPVCGNGADDDRDGLTDADDPGCDHAEDLDETSSALPCDDGVDGDRDGLRDWNADPGCFGPKWSAEDPACQNGADDDGDGRVDFDGGKTVHGAPIAEPDPRCAGAPFATSEASRACGLGCEVAAVLAWLVRRRVRHVASMKRTS
jgi:hypothetical protein